MKPQPKKTVKKPLSADAGLVWMAWATAPKPALLQVHKSEGRSERQNEQRHDRGVMLLEALEIRRSHSGLLSVHPATGTWGTALTFPLFNPAPLMEAACTACAEATIKRLCHECDVVLNPQEYALIKRRICAALQDSSDARGAPLRALLRLLDTDLVRCCAHIFGKDATLEDCNDVLRAGSATLVQLSREAPRLAPLLKPLVMQHARKGERPIDLNAFARIKAGFLSSGTALTQHHWRWLAQQRNGTVRALIEMSDSAWPDAARVRLLAAARAPVSGPLLSLLKPGGPLARALEEALAHDAQAWNSLTRLTHLLTKELAQRVAMAHPLRFVLDEFTTLIDWWVAMQRSGDKAALIRPATRYATLARRQALWHRRELQHHPVQMLRWQSALSVSRLMGMLVVPLNDSLMLAREGVDMQHCVATYARDCADGRVRIFAVTDLATQERATVELRRSGWDWVTGQIKGRANAAVPARFLRLTEHLRKRYAEAAAGLAVLKRSRDHPL
jgi:hypothetical protein